MRKSVMRSSPRRSGDKLQKGPLNPKESKERISEMIKHIELVMAKRLAQLEAEEDHAVEKCRAEVLEGPTKEIEESFRKREKAVVNETKSYNVAMVSKARIAALASIENCMTDIKKEVKHRVLCRLETDFAKVMEPLLFQGLILMLESEVTLRVRYSDRNKVKNFFDHAVQFYYKKTKDELKIKFDEINLPETEKGKMVLYNKRQSVMVSLDIMEKVDRVGTRILPTMLKMALAGKMAMPNLKYENILSISPNKISNEIINLPKEQQQTTTAATPANATIVDKISDPESFSKKPSAGLGISSSETFRSTGHEKGPSTTQTPKKKCCKHKSKKNEERRKTDKSEVGKTSKTAEASRQNKNEANSLGNATGENKFVAPPNENFGRIDFPKSPSPANRKSLVTEKDTMEPIIGAGLPTNSEQTEANTAAHSSVQKGYDVRKYDKKE